jgi:hypothetical protein
LPGFTDARVASFAPAMYVRETRHVAGLERLTTGDVWSGDIPADSIGLASYPIDLHPCGPRRGGRLARYAAARASRARRCGLGAAECG